MVKDKNQYAKIYESGRILLLRKDYLCKQLVEPIICLDTEIQVQILDQLKKISKLMTGLKDSIKLSILALFSQNKIHVSNIS